MTVTAGLDPNLYSEALEQQWALVHDMLAPRGSWLAFVDRQNLAQARAMARASEIWRALWPQPLPTPSHSSGERPSLLRWCRQCRRCLQPIARAGIELIRGSRYSINWPVLAASSRHLESGRPESPLSQR
jgi:hypothetical protein